jgi:uncharacterized damage-inducible protein DinB
MLTFAEVAARFTRAHERLLESVSRLADDDFMRNVAGRDYNVLEALNFVVDHSLYHAGQIALLKKACALPSR